MRHGSGQEVAVSTSHGSASGSCKDLLERTPMCEAAAGVDVEGRLCRRDSESILGGLAVRRRFAFAVPLFLVTFLSGGLLFGTAPFQEALVRNFDFSTAEAQGVIGRAFQVFVLGSALLAPVIDWTGPRWCAAVGLLIEVGCFFTLSRIQQVTKLVLSMALGGMGVGGNLLLYASAHFPLLFKSSSEAETSYDGLLQGCISSAYMVAGFIFMLLEFVDFVQFFTAYAVLAAIGLLLVVACYPDDGYTSSRQKPRWFISCGAQPRTSREVQSGGCEVMSHLRHLRTWLFFLSFGLCASCANWTLTIFIGVVAGPTRQSEALIRWMPVIANSTFIFSPCFGLWIDAKGFAGPVTSMGTMSVAVALSVGFLPLEGQWFTLLALNMLQSQVYSTQFMYLNKTYPGSVFGILMSLSCFVQSAINPTSLVWNDTRRKSGSLFFAVASALVCGAWALVESRQGAHPDSSSTSGSPGCTDASCSTGGLA